MDEKGLRLFRLSIAISLPIGILLLLAIDVFSAVSRLGIRWEYLGEVLGYKALLIILIFLLLAWSTSVFYYRGIIKSISRDESTKIKPGRSGKVLSVDEAIDIYKDSLQRLSAEEKAYLRGYILDNTKTQYFEVTDGVVQGLVAAKILYRSASITGRYSKSYIPMIAYNIQPWAWEYLNKHPELLD